MGKLKTVFILLFAASVVQFGCSNQAPKGPEPTPQATGQIEKAIQDEGMVTGCPDTTGTLNEAQAALETGDFAKANCIASNLFNESVTKNPASPDTKAAFLAFLAKLPLSLEKPEMTEVVMEPPLKAADYFGPGSDTDKLGTLMNDRWPNGKVTGF